MTKTALKKRIDPQFTLTQFENADSTEEDNGDCPGFEQIVSHCSNRRTVIPRERNVLNFRSVGQSDVIVVKTGISAAPPPGFLTKPLRLKSSQDKDPVVSFFHHQIKKNSQNKNNKNTPYQEVKPLNLKANTLEDTISTQGKRDTLKLQVLKESPKETVNMGELKQMLEQLLCDLKAASSIPLPPPLGLNSTQMKSRDLIKAKSADRTDVREHFERISKPGASFGFSTNHPHLVNPVIHKIPQYENPKKGVRYLHRTIVRELNKTMKKMSILGLILGLLLMGVLFFFIGFLVAYSSGGGQKKACPPPPETTWVKAQSKQKVPEKGEQKGKEEKSEPPKETAKRQAQQVVQQIVPMTGVSGAVAGALLGGQPPATAAERALQYKAESMLPLSLRFGALAPGIRPFAQEAQQFYAHQTTQHLAPRTAELQGPFSERRFGTTPPPVHGRQTYYEQGYGRGTLREAHQKRAGITSGIRPHVPKPVFAPLPHDAYRSGGGAYMHPQVPVPTQAQGYSQSIPQKGGQETGTVPNQPYYLIPIQPPTNYPPYGSQNGPHQNLPGHYSYGPYAQGNLAPQNQNPLSQEHLGMYVYNPIPGGTVQQSQTAQQPRYIGMG